MLSEKAVELSALSTELELKDVLREREVAAQRAKWELERESVSCSSLRTSTLVLFALNPSLSVLRKRYEDLERQLRDQYDLKVAQVVAEQREVDGLCLIIEMGDTVMMLC